MCKISLHFYDLLLTTSSIPGQLLPTEQKISLTCVTMVLQHDKTMEQQLKSWILNMTRCQWCNGKSSSTKSKYDKWNQTRNHLLLYHLLFTVLGISYPMCLSVMYYQISYIVSAIPQFNCNYCHHIFIVKLFLLYKIFSNASSTTYHISHNSCFSYSLVLFVPIYSINDLLESWRYDISMLESAAYFSLLLGRFSNQLPISGTSFSVVIVSATPLSYFDDDELFSWYG